MHYAPHTIALATVVYREGPLSSPMLLQLAAWPPCAHARTSPMVASRAAHLHKRIELRMRSSLPVCAPHMNLVHVMKVHSTRGITCTARRCLLHAWACSKRAPAQLWAASSGASLLGLWRHPIVMCITCLPSSCSLNKHALQCAVQSLWPAGICSWHVGCLGTSVTAGVAGSTAPATGLTSCSLLSILRVPWSHHRVPQRRLVCIVACPPPNLCVVSWWLM
mmetsp:Transcript_4566/g.12121  ORF Transcript_4566/g.12121 Transcript_4566/m.12121 type:complete len:221 (-) Transcript_4566:10-672(-)